MKDAKGSHENGFARRCSRRPRAMRTDDLWRANATGKRWTAQVYMDEESEKKASLEAMHELHFYSQPWLADVALVQLRARPWTNKFEHGDSPEHLSRQRLSVAGPLEHILGTRSSRAPHLPTEGSVPGQARRWWCAATVTAPTAPTGPGAWSARLPHNNQTTCGSTARTLGAHRRSRRGAPHARRGSASGRLAIEDESAAVFDVRPIPRPIRECLQHNEILR